MFKPMLSGKAPKNLEDISFPVYVSPKLDGIRCLIHDGQVMTRSLKPVPNEYIREQLTGLPDGLDGELLLRNDTGYNDTQSAVMSRSGEPDFVYHVFDWHAPDQPYNYRYGNLRTLSNLSNPCLSVVKHKMIEHVEQLLQAEQDYLAAGYEGLMVRSPEGKYKYGRSTTKQGWLLKLKRFDDAEAIVVDVQEQMHNANAAEVDNLGHAKRSTLKDGMVPNGKLGSLVCRNADGVEFNVGTGFTDAQRRALWARRAELFGQIVTYKHQPDPNNDDIAPRFPVFLHFRRD